MAERHPFFSEQLRLREIYFNQEIQSQKMEIFMQSSDSPILLALSKIELLKVLFRIIFNPGAMVGT